MPPAFVAARWALIFVFGFSISFALTFAALESGVCGAAPAACLAGIAL